MAARSLWPLTLIQKIQLLRKRLHHFFIVFLFKVGGEGLDEKKCRDAAATILAANINSLLHCMFQFIMIEEVGRAHLCRGDSVECVREVMVACLKATPT